MFGAWIGLSADDRGRGAAERPPADVPRCRWLAIPVITLSSRFSTRGVIVGVFISLALALAVAFGVDPHEVLANPRCVIVPVALILCVAVLSTPLMHSDIQHRSDAVIDQLTGMLNRKALSARVHRADRAGAGHRRAGRR